jgi:hypothetical protein
MVAQPAADAQFLAGDPMKEGGGCDGEDGEVTLHDPRDGGGRRRTLASHQEYRGLLVLSITVQASWHSFHRLRTRSFFNRILI